jgi:hypothetical protein
MAQELEDSGLDVTTLRAPMLYDGPRTKNYRVVEGEDYFTVLRISRSDLAHFLVSETTARQWVNKNLAIADPDTAE